MSVNFIKPEEEGDKDHNNRKHSSKNCCCNTSAEGEHVRAQARGSTPHTGGTTKEEYNNGN